MAECHNCGKPATRFLPDPYHPSERVPWCSGDCYERMILKKKTLDNLGKGIGDPEDLTKLWNRDRQNVPAGRKVHVNPDGSTVLVPRSAKIGDDVIIGAGAAIGENVTLYRDITVGPGARIGDGSYVDKYSKIGANAVIGKNVKVEDQVRVRSGDRIEDDTVVLWTIENDTGV